MKKALLTVALTTAILASGSLVQAEEIDVAQVKCSDFIQDKDNMGLILMWLDGYASQKSDNTVLSDEWFSKLSAHMGKFCSENPDTPILEAAQALSE